jgi:hypothetical protein
MPASSERTTFRLPRTAYIVVVFLAFGVWPFALSGGGDSPGTAGPARLSLLCLLFLLPVVVALFIRRTATIVDAQGITAQAVFGSAAMPWDDIRGISVRKSVVYAVLSDGSVRLPCVQISHLTALTKAAGDRLPELREPPVKVPPARQRRR